MQPAPFLKCVAHESLPRCEQDKDTVAVESTPRNGNNLDSFLRCLRGIVGRQNGAGFWQRKEAVQCSAVTTGQTAGLQSNDEMNSRGVAWCFVAAISRVTHQTSIHFRQYSQDSALFHSSNGLLQAIALEGGVWVWVNEMRVGPLCLEGSCFD